MAQSQAMPPEQMQADDAGASQSDPRELVSGIHTQLMALMDLMDKTESVTPEDKQALASIISQYQNFVSQNLGDGAQSAPQEPASARGNVSPEAGANPNARPM
jgi:hypothetical protein